uniref:3-hydroxyisobutyrate dehydrogenase-like NAD-binding domain-containing protein n=1 Tax=Aegilops tauschii subsp. strangulata TaxID=200361 RepID=A0A453RAT8_AEGTS
MFIGVRAGIHPSIIYDIISNAAGSSRIFVEVVPKILSEDPLLIDFLKSLKKHASYVMDTAKAATFPLPLLAVAYQQLIHGSSGVIRDESASPLKVWNNCQLSQDASIYQNYLNLNHHFAGLGTTIWSKHRRCCQSTNL